MQADIVYTACPFHRRHVVLKQVLLMIKESLPLLYCTLEEFVLVLQQRSLRTDMRDFLIICPIDAGRLVG